LLLWVHATLLDSSADIYQRLVAPLTPSDLDALCVESAPLLHELGGDCNTTPLTWHALQQYMASVYDSGVLTVTADARELGHAVLSPRAAGVPVPLSGLQRLITVGLLPPGIRLAYGFEWNAARERRFGRALRTLRAMRRVTPPVLAQWRMARRIDA
jgi:uncharacterized protein (DUF2236 family)